ncbi:porin family protein [Alteromonas sp. ASW11-130]|uniref:porin family protein n=1 Tax=Alteromonas sp. ASW11-130 TaxID=3015775 RepID=UPI0022420FCA|nr:outer membrane beta-barrel protein [Alteromonas sp. ASW11-130]MCW8092978.1 porin family protein [Alteromonas sp. ASW11-130]
MKKTLTAIAGLAALSSFTTFAQVHNDNGLAYNEGVYVGANYGWLRVESDDEFDDDKDVWQGVVGYRFNEYVALEGGYINFGDYGNGVAEASTDGFTTAIKGSYPITDKFSVYGKLGQLWWETDYRLGNLNGKYDDESLFVGGGVAYAINPQFSITAEYTVYDADLDAEDAVEDIDDTNFDTDLKQASIGVEYRF